ncbi:hypothetical protein DSECCO2_598400 [anaerobic digester metagenome]
MSMKKPILILFLSLLFLTTFSQQYYPLIEEGRSWNVMYVVPSWGPPFDSSCYSVNYLITGDSILNNIEYKKMITSIEEIPVNWDLDGFIREDSVNRVWYRRIVDTNEVLIYDFSLLTGDSLKLGFDTTMYYKVDSITTEIVSDSLRKKYWISQDDFIWKETWIEGIGSNKGILGSAMASVVGGWGWLLCMSDDGVLTYMNPDFDSCYINTGLNELHKPDLRIYPNPASDVIHCVLPDNEDYEIVVYNALGSIVHPSTPLRMTIEGDIINVNIEELTSGIYFIEARGERVLRGKFVKE